jgi:N-acetylmuramoyl-L-alanine amidase
MLMNEDYLDQSILLASYIQNDFEKTLKRKNRGVKQEGFIVLHQTYMPSVLIETGFLTNKSEGRYLSTKKGQSELANSIKGAIMKYRNNLNETFNQKLTINLESSNNIDGTNSELYSDITFKVQIAASSKKLEPKPYNFKKLSEISRKQVGKIYKYYYGETSDYTKIKNMKEEAYRKGYRTSFIVAYKDGKEIPLSAALKTSSN